MRLLALMVAAVLWGAPAQAETKNGPDGFGPIKFGMTKEEAWAAIGGKGEWTADNELTYTLDVSGWALFESEITVVQWFSKGKALDLNTILAELKDDNIECAGYLNTVVAYIVHRYGKPPIQMETRPSGSEENSISYYTFIFDNEVMINIIYSQFYFNRSENIHCSLMVSYHLLGNFGKTAPF